MFISEPFGEFLSLIQYFSVSAEASISCFNSNFMSSVQSSLKLKKAFPENTGVFMMAVGISLQANPKHCKRSAQKNITRQEIDFLSQYVVKSVKVNSMCSHQWIDYMY